MKYCLMMFLAFVAFAGYGQRNDSIGAGPVFVNEDEKVVYYVCRDLNMQKGTVSDALQNVPGVKVDTEGNITLHGVSTVEIWINDHPSHFDDESQKNYMQQTSAASVHHIEVMSNPSARYTSDTDTGIINIVTGENSRHSEESFNVGLQVNTSPVVAPSFAYHRSNGKISFDANIKGGYSNVKEHSFGWSTSFDESTGDTTQNKNFTTNQTSDTYEANMFFKLDCHLDRNNDLMAYFTLHPFSNRDASDSHTSRTEYNGQSNTEYDYTTSVASEENMYFGETGMFFQHRFKQDRHTIAANIDINFDHGETKKISIRNFETQTWLNRNTMETDVFTDVGWNAKVDYNLPLAANSDLYLGMVNSLKPDNNYGLFDTLNADGAYVIDWLRSEERRFSTITNSALVSLQQRLGHFTIKPGLCLENTIIKAVYFDTPQFNVLKNFLYWRPSLHISYRTPSMHNFSLSYTRKTTYDYVRHFTERNIYLEDQINMGNTNLKPTLTNNYEATWTKYWNGFGSMGVLAYYRVSKDVINQVTGSVYDSLYGRVIDYDQSVNLGEYYDAGFELNTTYRPNSLLNIRLYANIYDSHIETLFDQTGDSLIVSDMWAYSLRLNFWTKLWNRLEFHASAYYNSPTQSLFAMNQTAYGIDCGLRADFFKNKLSLLLNANDIFNWNKEDNYIYSPTKIAFSSYKANSRYLSLEVIYRFSK